MASDELASTLEATIIRNGIDPEMVKDNPNPKVISEGSPTLKLLASMWTQQAPTRDALDELDEEKGAEALGLVLKHGVHPRSDLFPLLKQLRFHLLSLATEPEFSKNLILYIETKVPSQFADFKHGMATIVTELGDFDCLGEGEFDWLVHLNRWFALTGGDLPTWKAAKKLGKTENLKEYPNIRAFANGETIPPELERKGAGRAGLLNALINVHGRIESELINMGFFAAEIKDAGGADGLFAKIKRFFS